MGRLSTITSGIRAAVGEVETVEGPLPATDLGVTLSHEHLFCNGSSFLEEAMTPEARLAASCEVSVENRDLLRKHSCANADNVMLDDCKTAISEVTDFRTAGGDSIVDLTSEGLGPSPLAVKAVAEATGVRIVHGCGPYCEYALSPWNVDRGTDEIAASILKSLEQGIDGTSVRAGVIGEIGVNGQLLGETSRSCLVTPTEERGLRAAARVSLSTGTPVVVHQPDVPDATRAIIRILDSEGVPPEQVCLGHMSSVLDPALHVDVLRRGYWIAYDNFGMDLENRFLSDSSDSRRVAWLVSLLTRHFGDRILVSQDIWSKIQLRRFGGGGYTHLHRVVLPWLRHEGVSERAIAALMIDNPRRFFARR